MVLNIILIIGFLMEFQRADRLRAIANYPVNLTVDQYKSDPNSLGKMISERSKQGYTNIVLDFIPNEQILNKLNDFGYHLYVPINVITAQDGTVIRYSDAKYEARIHQWPVPPPSYQKKNPFWTTEPKQYDSNGDAQQWQWPVNESLIPYLKCEICNHSRLMITWQ